MMIISKYGFYDLITQVAEGVDIRLDPSRMAQGIVTGVGFLGAGMIYMSAGPPVNESALWFIEVDLPKTRIRH